MAADERHIPRPALNTLRQVDYRKRERDRLRIPAGGAVRSPASNCWKVPAAEAQMPVFAIATVPRPSSSISRKGSRPSISRRWPSSSPARPWSRSLPERRRRDRCRRGQGSLSPVRLAISGTSGVGPCPRRFLRRAPIYIDRDPLPAAVRPPPRGAASRTQPGAEGGTGPGLEPSLGFGRVCDRSDIERCAHGRARRGDAHRCPGPEGPGREVDDGLLHHGPRDPARTPGNRSHDVRRDGFRDEAVGPRDVGQPDSRACVPPFGSECWRQLSRARPPGPGRGRIRTRRCSRSARSGPADARQLHPEFHLRIRMHRVTLRAVRGHGFSSHGRPDFVMPGSEIRGRRSEVR